jgi:uncharacterized protein YhbP (UPF0306 family)
MQSARYPDLVREIVTENHYLSLATTDGDEPWVAPVEYAFDEHLNLYFVSLTTSRHARQLERNPVVAVAIFDSRQPAFTGKGVQIRGRATKHSDTENPFVTVAGRSDMSLELSAYDADYAAFRIEPQEFYLVKGYVEEEWRDERVRVDMTL